jgi:hypothetical protein
MTNNSRLSFEDIFLIGGMIVLPWGIVSDSMVKVIGGLGMIFLALIILYIATNDALLNNGEKKHDE